MTFFERILKLFGYSEIGDLPKTGEVFQSCHDCFLGPGSKSVKLPNGDLIYLCERHYELRNRN